MQVSKLHVNINLMKTLRSLIGLALLSAGLFLSYLAFNTFNTLESTQLSLYLISAFILMTLGLYLFLLTFLSKKNVHSFAESLEEALDITDVSETQEQIEALEETIEEDQAELEELKETVSMIENTMVLNLFEDRSIAQKTGEENPSQALTDIQIKADKLSVEETETPKRLEEVQVTPINTEETITEAYDEESTQTLKNFFGEETKDPEDDVYSTELMDARLIGIEGWTLQNRLKKIPEGSECSLQINTKQGLKSAEIYYEKALIGYLSKVDYNKMEDKLPKLYKINLVTKILENKKLVTILLRFSFKD